ncbi:HEAT repeat domain-containing protein [Anatilimnocola sp. NA78]|uniref:HEAT repeat domain-containing protein n=1 Tax=Anatilimnocola sp. NA78 TaxID=3415683 RepID=UPI003CE5A1F6
MVLRRTVLLIALAIFLPADLGCFRQPSPEDELLVKLKSKDANLRWTAALLIRDSPPVPAVLVNPLMHALQDDDPKVRRVCAEALGEAGAHGKPHLPALTEMANHHHDAEVRHALHQSIVKITAAQ